MAFTVLTATDRIVMTYVVSGKTHVAAHYCKRGADVAGLPALISSDGVTLEPWQDASNGMLDAISTLTAAMDGNPNFILEHRVGTVWNPVASYSPAATAGGSVVPASQFTLVLRDTAFKKIRVVVLDTKIGYVGHSPTGIGIDSTTDTFVAAYDGTSGNSDHPWNWMKSRGDHYLLSAGAVAGGTYDLNDKVKRSRGLE